MSDDKQDFPHSDVSHTIIGGFFDVYNQLGIGFLESVYESALAIELRIAGLEAIRQFPITVHFRGHSVGHFKSDLLVNQCVMVEIKRARRLHSRHKAQLYNALKATEIELGLLPQFWSQA